MVADLRAIVDGDEFTSAFAAPPSTGDHRWDTLIAAAVAREAVRSGRDALEWTHTPPLDEPWFPDPNPILADRQVAATPPERAECNIFFDKRGLESL